MAEPPPELSAHAQLARHCWSFCDGWNPERWLVYGALYEVDDWSRLVDLMQAIRVALRKRDEA